MVQAAALLRGQIVVAVDALLGLLQEIQVVVLLRAIDHLHRQLGLRPDVGKGRPG